MWSMYVPIQPIHVKSCSKVKMKQAEVSLNIAQNHLISPYEVIIYVDIICANSYQKLTKSEIGWTRSQIKHFSESLV